MPPNIDAATSGNSIEVKLVRKDGRGPLANELVTVLEPSGAPIARAWTDDKGHVVLPRNGSEEVAFRVGAATAETYLVEPGGADGPIDVEVDPSTAPVVRVYGQVVDRKGQPAPGVGLVAMRDGRDEPLANTVTDSNGGFMLPLPADEDSGHKYQLYISVKDKAIPIKGLDKVRKKVVGPLTIVVAHAPSHSAVAPKLQLIADEEDIIDAFKNARQLFSRPIAARAPDPCSPANPAEIPARVFYLQQLVMFPRHALRGEEIANAMAGLRMREAGPFYALARHEVAEPVDFFATNGEVPRAEALRYGALMEFRQEWWDFGYTLGDLLYSVPLAPAEQTKIATVDWRRRDYAKQQTALDESVFQDTTISRDEAINEAVRMISDKHVSGSSEGGGFGLTLGPISGGWAKNVESMDETTDASTTASRFINDRIQQASNTLRNTRSFAIAEVSQEEESTVRTRVLTNYNHSHTLTFQYFQVLRNFLLRTKMNSLRPAVFVPFKPLDFTQDVVVKHAFALRRGLLDPTLERPLDKILGLVDDTTTATDTQAGSTQTAANSSQPTDQQVVEFRVSAVAVGELEAGTVIPSTGISWIETELVVNEHEMTLSSVVGPEEDLTKYIAKPQSPIPLSSIYKIGVQDRKGQATHWTFDDFTVEANVGTHDNPKWQGLFFKPTFDLHPGRRFIEQISTPTSVTGSAPPIAPSAATPEADITRLIAHLNANRVYYTGVVIAGEDAGSRYMILSQYTDAAGNNLADIVDNTVAGIDGNYLGFALRGLEHLPAAYRGTKTSWLGDPPQERIITLPTPGVYAESQLGSCSASEIIDDRRFWDWQKSPIPDQAPDITEGMLASRYEDLKGLLQVVKSDLQPPAVQIPQEPEPMIKIGDATLSELVKNLDLKDVKDVEGLVKSFVESSAKGFDSMMTSISKTSEGAQPSGSTPGTGGVPATTGGTAGGTDALGGTAGAADALGPTAGEGGAAAAGTDAGLAETGAMMLA
jgi:hypothetical protein